MLMFIIGLVSISCFVDRPVYPIIALSQLFQCSCNEFLVFKFNKVDLHFIILQILVPLDNEKYYIFTGVNS